MGVVRPEGAHRLDAGEILSQQPIAAAADVVAAAAIAGAFVVAAAPAAVDGTAPALRSPALALPQQHHPTLHSSQGGQPLAEGERKGLHWYCRGWGSDPLFVGSCSLNYVPVFAAGPRPSSHSLPAKRPPPYCSIAGFGTSGHGPEN